MGAVDGRGSRSQRRRSMNRDVIVCEPVHSEEHAQFALLNDLILARLRSIPKRALRQRVRLGVEVQNYPARVERTELLVQNLAQRRGFRNARIEGYCVYRPRKAKNTFVLVKDVNVDRVSESLDRLL